MCAGDVVTDGKGWSPPPRRRPFGYGCQVKAVVAGVLFGLVGSVTVVSADDTAVTGLVEAAVAALPRDPTLENLAKGAVNRGRRAIVVGPTFSVGLQLDADTNLDVPFSGGLALELYKVPVIPDRAVIEDIIKNRVRDRLKQRLADAMAGRQEQLSDTEIETLAREVYADVKAEVLGLDSRRSQTFEKPRLALALELAYLPEAEAIGGRFTARYGIGPISLGPVISAYKFDRADLLLGGEVALAAMPNGGARANAYELFLRVDTGVRDVGLGFTLGVRAVLDII